MSNENNLALASSIAYYGAWLQEQRVRELTLLQDGAIQATFQVPIAWPTPEGGREESRYMDFNGSIFPTFDESGNETLIAEAQILRNFQELYEEASDQMSGYTVSMFPKFYSWLVDYVNHMDEHGITYEPQLFSSALSALENTYDVSQLRDACTLDFLMSVDEGSHTKQNLSIGWRGSMDVISTLFSTLSQDPDLWGQAHIGGDCGDWDAFVQYMIVDIRASWERVMPLLADAAALFSVEHAPRIVYEAVAEAHAAGIPDTTFIPQVILGHALDENPWFRNQMRIQMDEFAAKYPLIESLQDGTSLRYAHNLRPAMAMLGDSPIGQFPHFVGRLDTKGTRNGRRIEFILTPEGLIAEVPIHGTLERILKYGPKFLEDWDKTILPGAYHVSPRASTIDLHRESASHLVLQGKVTHLNDKNIPDMLYWLSSLAPELEKLIEKVNTNDAEDPYTSRVSIAEFYEIIRKLGISGNPDDADDWDEEDEDEDEG